MTAIMERIPSNSTHIDKNPPTPKPDSLKEIKSKRMILELIANGSIPLGSNQEESKRFVSIIQNLTPQAESLFIAYLLNDNRSDLRQQQISLLHSVDKPPAQRDKPQTIAEATDLIYRGGGGTLTVKGHVDAANRAYDAYQKIKSESRKESLPTEKPRKSATASLIQASRKLTTPIIKVSKKATQILSYSIEKRDEAIDLTIQSITEIPNRLKTLYNSVVDTQNNITEARKKKSLKEKQLKKAKQEEFEVKATKLLKNLNPGDRLDSEEISVILQYFESKSFLSKLDLYQDINFAIKAAEQGNRLNSIQVNHFKYLLTM
jgi:hypothetical protein